jgi:hypothetical protein
MTVRQAIDKLGTDAIKSIVAEMMSLNSIGTFEGVDVSSMSREQLRLVITSKLFLKEKYSAEGLFEKLKARLVAGGHLQDREIYDNARSPTASTTSLFMVAAIAASEGRAVATIDFPSAFLNSEMPTDGPQVLMKLNKFETMVLCSIDKKYNKFVRDDGTCVVRLRRALYGCVESARLWYEKLTADLERLGFVKNKLDECVMNRIDADGKQQTLIIHVDDVMITACSEAAIDGIIAEIQGRYPSLVIKRGRRLTYLGMIFDFQETGKVKVTMDHFVAEFLDDFAAKITGVAQSPASDDLFKVNESSTVLHGTEKAFFHSATAKLLYLGKRVRPDILTAVSFLCKRVTAPTEQDSQKLKRLIRYLRGSRDKGICFEGSKQIQVYAYVDSSYGVHTDLKSHTGVVIGIGKGPVYAKSSGQKLNTKSSTEAELVGLSDSTPQVIWARAFLEEQGYAVGAAKVYQDNMSTIALVKNGKSNSNRTRHIAVRFFFVADRVKSKEINIEYMPTGEMLADILTKPLQGALFKKLRNQLLNWPDE